jgi:hypothetical protein
MLVSIPESVSHHFRISGPRPTQTLEHDLANKDGKSHVMLPIRVSAARLSAVGGYFADVVATHPDGNTTEREAHWPMHHQIIELQNPDGLACLLMLIAIHGRHSSCLYSSLPNLSFPGENGVNYLGWSQH